MSDTTWQLHGAWADLGRECVALAEQMITRRR